MRPAVSTGYLAKKASSAASTASYLAALLAAGAGASAADMATDLFQKTRTTVDRTSAIRRGGFGV
jgi:hypothetical protein